MKYIITAFFLFIAHQSFAQDHPSIHEQEWQYYHDHPDMVGTSVVHTPLAKREDLMKTTQLTNVVYGFHPYWENSAESNYYFSLLTHMAYFSGDIDPTTGNFSSTHSWASANVVSLAQQYGVKVHFTIVLFSNHSALLGSTANKNNLIKNIMTQVNLRNADGVNVDFESISSSQATAYKNFLKQLGDTLKAHNKELVVELFAVDWSNIFPSTFFQTLDPVVDYYFIMLYAYYYSGSSTAGPNSPLRATNASGYHVLKSIKSYLDKGCPASKLIAGFPNYGNEWPVSSNARMASTTGKGVSRTFTVVKNSYLSWIPDEDKFFDATYNTPWYRYNSNGWYQCWYDDSLSWSMKFDSIKVKNIAGTGMWALGYDGTETDLWGAIKASFAVSTSSLATTIDDFETSQGHLSSPPTFSGTTAGIATSSSVSWTTGASNEGWGADQIVLKDDATSSADWVVRCLSGGGDPANNIEFTNSSYVGFWMRTGTAPSGAQVALSVDNGSIGTLISEKQHVINDGAWHLYEWNMAETPFTVLSGTDSTLTSASATLDAIMLYAPNQSADWISFVDDIKFNIFGTISSAPIVSRHSAAPSRFVILQNYPNPFNPSTTILFSVPTSGHTTVRIYNALGQVVKTLFDGTATGGQDHRIVFNADGLSSGMYFVRLEHPENSTIKKIVLLR